MAESQSVFERAAVEGGLAGVLQTLTEAEQTELEQTPATADSPGVIQTSEGLIRALDQPVHFVDGEFTPSAFGDAQSRGLSINRPSHISISEALQLAYSRVAAVNRRQLELAAATGTSPPPARSTVAYATFSTAELRAVCWSLQGPSRRAFGVYDTGKPDDPSHGDVCLLIAGKQAWRSVREVLYQQARRTVTML